jgi:hypothetical protein
MRLFKYILIIGFFLSYASDSIAVSNPIVKHRDSLSRINTVDDFLSLSPKEFSRLTGKKLNFLQRLAYRIEQRKLVRELKKPKHSSSFKNTMTDVLWFFLGAIIIGIPLAYIIKTKKKEQKDQHIEMAKTGIVVFLKILAALALAFLLLLLIFGGPFCEDCK